MLIKHYLGVYTYLLLKNTGYINSSSISS